MTLDISQSIEACAAHYGDDAQATLKDYNLMDISI